MRHPHLHFICVLTKVTSKRGYALMTKPDFFTRFEFTPSREMLYRVVGIKFVTLYRIFCARFSFQSEQNAAL